MNHEYFQDRLSGYHDGDLTPEEMQVLRQHVGECAECRAKLEQYQKLDRLVTDKSGLSDNEYWEESAQKIEARLGIEVASATEVIDIRSGRSWMGWKVAGTIAAVLALTFVGLHQADILKISSGSISETPASPAEKVGIIEEDSTDEAMLSDDQHLAPQVTIYNPEGEPVDEEDQALSEVLEPADETFASGDAEPAKGLIRGRDTEELSGLTVDGVAAESEQDTPAGATGDARLIQLAGDSAATSAKVMRTKDLLERFSVSVPAKSPAPAKGEPPETAAETIASKAEIKKKPVTSVDKLLESASGVVSDNTGEIFIRGGRAGEVAYIIRSDSTDTITPGSTPQSGGFLAKDFANNGSHDGTIIEVDIDHWRSVRDSLEATVSVQPQVLQSAQKSETKDQRKQKSLEAEDERTLDYLEALYHIGILTDNKAEYEGAQDWLGKYRHDERRAIREQAEEYHKLLEGRFE